MNSQIVIKRQTIKLTKKIGAEEMQQEIEFWGRLQQYVHH